MGSLQYGWPTIPKGVAKGRTPEELEPKVVKDWKWSDVVLEIQVQRPGVPGLSCQPNPMLLSHVVPELWDFGGPSRRTGCWTLCRCDRLS